MKQEINSNLIINNYAHYFKVLGNSTRLCILKKLCEHEKLKVGELSQCSKQAQSYVSQELNKLKKWNIVACEKDGAMCYYFLIDKKIMQILKTICCSCEFKGD